MRRASEIKRAGEWDAKLACDVVALDADARHRRRIVLTSEKGTCFLLDLPEAVSLQNGDGLVLDDGAIVRVEGKPEPLIEISAKDTHALARLAWHLGNRHAEVQIVGSTLRIRRDHVLEEMLKNLGATLHPIDTVFDPERGAYGQTHGHANDHNHGHHHEHDHASDPEHAHEHGLNHDHG